MNASIIMYTLIMAVSPILFNTICSIRQTKICYFFTAIFIFALSLPLGLRGVTGTDSAHYYTLYVYGEQYWDRSSPVERGYLALVDFCHHLNLSFTAFSFFIAFVTVALFCTVILMERSNINVCVATCIFISIFYFKFFNISRQCLSVGLCLLGFELCLRNKRVMSILLVLLAATIHTAAIISLVFFAYYVLPAKFKTRYMTYAVVFITALLVLNLPLLANIVEFILNSYFAGYFRIENFSISRIFGNLILLLPYIVLLFLNRDRDIIFLFSCIGILLTSIGSDTGRAGLYFLSLLIVSASSKSNQALFFRLLGRLFVISKYEVTICIYLYAFTYFSYTILFSNYGEIIPYHPFV